MCWSEQSATVREAGEASTPELLHATAVLSSPNSSICRRWFPPAAKDAPRGRGHEQHQAALVRAAQTVLRAAARVMVEKIHPECALMTSRDSPASCRLRLKSSEAHRRVATSVSAWRMSSHVARPSRHTRRQAFVKLYFDAACPCVFSCCFENSPAMMPRKLWILRAGCKRDLRGKPLSRPSKEAAAGKTKESDESWPAPAQLLGRPCEPLTGPAGGGARLRVCSRWFAGSPGRSVRCDGTRCRMMVATVLRIWASALFGLCHTLRTDTVTNLASVQNCFKQLRGPCVQFKKSTAVAYALRPTNNSMLLAFTLNS